ncbi:MAG: DUF3014 domain-containing protein [Myxococcales bacterium]
MNSNSRVVVIIVVLAAAAGAVLWWRRAHPTRPAAPVPSLTKPVAAPTPVAPPPAPLPVAPAIRYPIESVAARGPGESSDAYLQNLLVGLLGNKAVQAFLLTDDLAHRLVATVNNLATDESASDLWPVRRTPGPFQVQRRGQGEAGSFGAGGTISPANARRYAAFMRLVDGIDTQRAAAAYVRAYPVLQQAYEELGFTGKYLNDRVVEVIDHLLATPDVTAPPQVKRVQAPGAPTAGPDLYVFADPGLEARSTGQKILLRVGPENEAKLKAKLIDLRQQIARTR